jgi:hypothetical protein
MRDRLHERKPRPLDNPAKVLRRPDRNRDEADERHAEDRREYEADEFWVLNAPELQQCGPARSSHPLSQLGSAASARPNMLARNVR